MDICVGLQGSHFFRIIETSYFGTDWENDEI